MLIHQLSALYYSGFWGAMDWVFPPECAACGESGYRLCLSCIQKIHFIEDRPEKRPAVGTQSKTGSLDRSIPDHCTDSRHLAHYEGVIRECIHSIKYHENRGLGEFLSRWLVSLVKEASWPVDLVIPVPLSEKRIKERGYNQSAMIARPLAARLQVPFNHYGLERVLDTPSQVGLSKEERQRNVAGAFIAHSEIVKSKNILLVDDVMTTGSTLSACAEAVLHAGGQKVYAITIGRHIDWTHASALKIHQV